MIVDPIGAPIVPIPPLQNWSARSGIVRVERPVVGDMRDARADQTADDHRDREGIDPLVANQVPRAADRDEAANEHADEREERVPGDPERPDHQIRVEGELDQVG